MSHDDDGAPSSATFSAFAPSQIGLPEEWFGIEQTGRIKGLSVCISDLSAASRKERGQHDSRDVRVPAVAIPLFPDDEVPSSWDSVRVDECTIVASLWSQPWGLQGVRVPFPLEEIWEHVHPVVKRGGRAGRVPRYVLDDDVKLEHFPVRGYKTYTWGLTVIPRSASLMGNMVVSTGQDATLRLFKFPSVGSVGGSVKEVACLTRKDPGSGTKINACGQKLTRRTGHRNVSDSVTFCNTAYVESRETLFTCGRFPADVVTWDLHKLVQKDAVSVKGSQAFAICKVEEGSASFLPPGCFVGDSGGYIRFWSLKEGLAADCEASNGPAIKLHERQANFYAILFHPESHLIYAGGVSENLIRIYDVRMTSSTAATREIGELNPLELVRTPSGVCNFGFLGKNLMMAGTPDRICTWRAGTAGKGIRRLPVPHELRGLRYLGETTYDSKTGESGVVAEDEVERMAYLFQVLGDDGTSVSERVRIAASGGSADFALFSSFVS